MRPGSPPPFEQVYTGKLKEFVQELQSTLDTASDDGVKVSESRNWKHVDPGLHAFWARVYTGNRLDDVIAQFGLPLKRVRETNSGLYFVSDDFALRVLKAGHDFDDEGNIVRRLPTPGHSRARSQYYMQEDWQPPLFNDPAQAHQPTFAGMGQQLRLLLLWDVDNAFQLNALDLVCPRSGARTKDTVKYWWYESVLERASNVGRVAPPQMPAAPLADPAFKLRAAPQQATP